MRSALRAAGVAALLLLAACSGGSPAQDRPAAAVSSAAPPRLGGPSALAQPVPSRPMNRLERQVALRLAAQVRRDGLGLDYLDCPRWDGRVPQRMTCTGWVAGVRADVTVHLGAAVEGRAVAFDARLERGVVATRALEQSLEAREVARADCGAARAYPAEVGTRIVCALTPRSGGRRTYVVATVTSRSGAVTIEPYAP